MTRDRVMGLVLGVMLLMGLSVSAMATAVTHFSDDFEGYAAGTSLDGLGTWTGSVNCVVATASSPDSGQNVLKVLRTASSPNPGFAVAMVQMQTPVSLAVGQTYTTSFDYYLPTFAGNGASCLFYLDNGTNGSIRFCRMDIAASGGVTYATYPGETNVSAGFTVARNQWYRISVTLTVKSTGAVYGATIRNYGTLATTTLCSNITAGATAIPGSTIRFGVSPQGGTAPYQAGGYFDNLNVVSDAIPLTVTGAVVPGGFTGSLQDVAVKLEFSQNGIVMATQRTFLDAGGHFSVPANVLPGTYDVAVTGNSWRRNVRTVTIGADPADLGTFTLGSGDHDGDNAVTSTDLSIVLANQDAVGD